jgi:hypothetical protein
MKVRRAVRKLENRGLISTRILGRDKPYRLTPYAIERLYHLARPDGGDVGLMSKGDMALYVSTLTTGLVTFFLTWQALGKPSPVLVVLFSGIFFYLLGVSSSKILGLLRRIS